MGNEATIKTTSADKSGKASLFLVDPNPPGRDVVPNEDLFMYVKLQATKKNRSVLEVDGSSSGAEIFNTSDSDGVINFIATSVDKGSTEQTITNSYATTDWTNMGGVKDGSSGILEGFGINSINISFGAALVPKVDITFTDLRGSSLFNVIDSENRQSPYSVFFSLPYPVFKLTVKGYYGKAVTYCLHMVKSNFDFDGSTGNFQIKANFVGFQQAFLADMVLGNIVGVVNTRAGADALSKLTIKDSNGVEKPTPKIDEFINEISNLKGLTESLKEDSDTFQTLKILNTELSKLKRLLSFFGKPIENTRATSQTDVTGGKAKDKASKKLQSDNIGYNGLTPNIDYTIIRDILIVKHVQRGKFLDFAQKTYELYDDYVKFEKTENNLDNPFSKFPFTKPDENSGDEYTFTEFFSKLKDPGVADTFESLYTNQLIPENVYLKDPETVNWANGFDFKSLEEQRGNYFGGDNFSNVGDDKVFAMDLYPFRNELEILYLEKKSELDKLQEQTIIELNESLSKKLSFNPYIREVINVFTNNTEAMLTAIYDVSRKAEGLSSARLKALDGKATTDVKKKVKGIYAWPDIVQTQEKNQKDSKWIGDIIPIDSDETYLFPEISFVEEVVDGYLTSTNRINSDSETASKGTVKDVDKNWYPITPYDYKSLPYSDLNNPSKWDVKSPEGIPESLIIEIIDRVAFLASTSKYNNYLKEYGILDGSYSGINTKDQDYSELIISQLTGEVVVTYATDNEIIKPIDLTPGSDVGDNKWIKREINVGSFEIDGKSTSDNSYLYIEDDLSNSIGSSILKNTIGISPKIKAEKSAKASIDKIANSYKTNNIDEGIKYFNVGYKLPTHNISYLVWDKKIGKNPKENIDKDNINFILPFESINDFDGSAQNGQSNNNFIGFLKTETPNIFKSNLYSGQTDNKSQALLLLNTLPFENPNNIIPLLGDVAKVIKLPKYYLLWLCGSIWRYEESSGVLANDPIIWSGGEVGQPSTSNFLYNVGKNKSYADTLEGRQIPNLLLTLPPKTKELLINYYKGWVEGGSFDVFSGLMSSYSESLEINDQTNNKYTSDINSLIIQLKQQVRVISTAPNLWTEKLLGNIIELVDIETYVTNYVNSFRKLWQDDNIKEKSTSENDDGNNSEIATTNNSDLKNVFYKYFKNIYDKWIGGGKDGRVFNTCGPSEDENLIDYFKFINRSWGDIGDSAAVNLNSVATLSGDYDINMYFYLAKVLRDSNFLLQILPTYINFKDEKEVQEIFKPITNVDRGNVSSGPIYTCIYAGGNSKSLEIEDGDYVNDGFNMNEESEVPEEFNSSSKPTDTEGLPYNLVAFRVAFGTENQSIFKNLNLNQEEHRETGEYFKVLTELIDNRGGSKRTYQGTDLYQIYQSRSYKCKVDALGCMNIQPLMYFQLDNVPFFRGAYLITNVSHSITPNHITTNFEGVRQSSVSTPIIGNATTFLNLNLTEEIEQESIDLKPPNRNPVTYGVDQPNQPFNFDFLPSLQFLALGVPQETAITLSDDTDTDSKFKQILLSFDIKTNAEVTMFLSQVLYESSNMTTLSEVWDNPTLDDNRIAQNGTDEQLAYEPDLNSVLKNSLGNTEPGDGYLFRGRGMFHITGREQYTKLSKDVKFKKWLGDGVDLMTNLDLLSSDVLIALASACWFWEENKLNEIVDGGTFTDEEKPKTQSNVSKPKNNYNAGTSAAYGLVSNKITPKDYKHSIERYDVLGKVLTLLNLRDPFNL